MLRIELDPPQEQRFRKLAETKNQDPVELIREALEEYLAWEEMREDTPEQWAAASVAMLPEVLPEESWDDGSEIDES